MTARPLKQIRICAADLLDAARTIPSDEVSVCPWLVDWTSASTFIEWARRGLSEKDSYGLSNAIGYAKRAVACRIDTLVFYNHLTPFFSGKYPSKIEALGQAGVSVPDVVHELVIAPRNDLEHKYCPPKTEIARHAVGVAELFVQATEEEYQQYSIIAVGWNVLGSHTLTSSGERIRFREFGIRPMLFIDVFAQPHAAKIVDPANGEVRVAVLSSFSKEEAMVLARLLRRQSPTGTLTRHGASAGYFRAIKEQAGF